MEGKYKVTGSAGKSSSTYFFRRPWLSLPGEWRDAALGGAGGSGPPIRCHLERALAKLDALCALQQSASAAEMFPCCAPCSPANARSALLPPFASFSFLFPIPFGYGGLTWFSYDESPPSAERAARVSSGCRGWRTEKSFAGSSATSRLASFRTCVAKSRARDRP